MNENQIAVTIFFHCLQIVFGIIEIAVSEGDSLFICGKKTFWAMMLLPGYMYVMTIVMTSIKFVDGYRRLK